MASLLIIGSSGTSDPTRASIPFHIAANGAGAADVEASILLAGDATGLLAPGVAETVRGVGIAPLTDLLQKCRSAGIDLFI